MMCLQNLKKVPDTFDISPVSLDDIIVYIARGIDNSKEVGR